MIWTVNTPRRWLFWQAGKLFHRLKSGALLSMSTHLPPLQLCLMIWTELKSVRRVMFRETESRVTMETRLQVQQCREYWICSCESYTMSQTDIRNSNRYQQAPVKMSPSHSSTAEFYFPLIALRLHRWRRRCRHVMICLSVSRVKLRTQQIPLSPESFKFFWQPQLLSASLSAWSKPQLQTFSEPMWVHAWVCVYFPYGCSRSPLNKTVVPLLSKPTSFVSNEHLPGSLPTTAGFSVSPCQQPMTLICCFIAPKRCVWVCAEEWARKTSTEKI